MPTFNPWPRDFRPSTFLIGLAERQARASCPVEVLFTEVDPGLEGFQVGDDHGNSDVRKIAVVIGYEATQLPLSVDRASHHASPVHLRGKEAVRVDSGGGGGDGGGGDGKNDGVFLRDVDGIVFLVMIMTLSLCLCLCLSIILFQTVCLRPPPPPPPPPPLSLPLFLSLSLKV